MPAATTMMAEIEARTVFLFPDSIFLLSQEGFGTEIDLGSYFGERTLCSGNIPNIAWSGTLANIARGIGAANGTVGVIGHDLKSMIGRTV